MEAEFWQARWQRGEIGWHEDEINAHLVDHWSAMGLAAGDRVFVPLCGKTLDMLWLAGQGHRVLGVELSRIAVESFFTDNGLEPVVDEMPPFARYRHDEIELLCGDFFALRQAHLDDTCAVYDRASLIAFPPQSRPRYAEHLGQLLDRGTKMLLVTLEYDEREMSGPPFSVSRDEVEALFAARFRIEPRCSMDVWAENPRFQRRGLSRLHENVYLLEPLT